MWTVKVEDFGYPLEVLWTVCYDGRTVFRADKESDAVWLADLFNRLGTVPPAHRN